MIQAVPKCNPTSVLIKGRQSEIWQQKRGDGNKKLESCVRKGTPAKGCSWSPEAGKRNGNGFFPRAP